MNSKNGFTFVALVITVLVMIILATVTIWSLENTEIINKSEGAVDEQNLQTEQERLDVAKGEVLVANGGKITVEKYVAKLIKEGITTESQVTDGTNGVKTVVTDMGYVVIIEPKGSDDIKVTIAGKAGVTEAKIKNLILQAGVNNIQVNVTLSQGMNVTYSYYYRIKDSESDYILFAKDISSSIKNIT